MVKEKRILSYFIGWLLIGITICFVGVSNVFADTIDQSITFATEVNQEFYSGGGDEWITCTNYTCPLWTNPTKNGTITWIAYKFYTELKANTTYYIELTTTFDYKNNSNTNIPVWKFSNYYGNGDNFKPNVHYMNYCNLVDSENQSNKDIYKWKCSLTPTSNANEFQFYFWTNQNYNALSQNGIFMAGNKSTITLNSLKFSYLDNTTGALITQNEIIINQNNQTNEKLDNIKDYLEDDTVPNLEILGDSAGWLPAGPLDSVLNLPLTMMNNLLTNLGRTCSTLKVKLPFVNENIEIPCIESLMEKMNALVLWRWIGRIASVIILYSYLMNLYAWVDKVLTLRAELDEAMGVDLGNWGRL